MNPLPYKQVYTIVDGIKGQGQYVGTYLAWGVHNNGWWGEGEIKFYMDGDVDFPTINGTGTEDYFNGSYDFEHPEKQKYGNSRRRTPGLIQVLKPRRPVPDAAALWVVPLAHPRSGALRARPQDHHPGAGMAQRGPLSAANRRHRIGRVLVPARAACTISENARPRRARGELKGATLAAVYGSAADDPRECDTRRQLAYGVQREAAA